MRVWLLFGMLVSLTGCVEDVPTTSVEEPAKVQPWVPSLDPGSWKTPLVLAPWDALLASYDHDLGGSFNLTATAQGLVCQWDAREPMRQRGIDIAQVESVTAWCGIQAAAMTTPYSFAGHGSTVMGSTIVHELVPSTRFGASLFVWADVRDGNATTATILMGLNLAVDPTPRARALLSGAAFGCDAPAELDGPFNHVEQTLRLEHERGPMRVTYDVRPSRIVDVQVPSGVEAEVKDDVVTVRDQRPTAASDVVLVIDPVSRETSEPFQDAGHSCGTPMGVDEQEWVLDGVATGLDGIAVAADRPVFDPPRFTVVYGLR